MFRDNDLCHFTSRKSTTTDFLYLIRDRYNTTAIRCQYKDSIDNQHRVFPKIICVVLNKWSPMERSVPPRFQMFKSCNRSQIITARKCRIPNLFHTLQIHFRQKDTTTKSTIPYLLHPSQINIF